MCHLPYGAQPISGRTRIQVQVCLVPEAPVCRTNPMTRAGWAPAPCIFSETTGPFCLFIPTPSLGHRELELYPVSHLTEEEETHRLLASGPLSPKLGPSWDFEPGLLAPSLPAALPSSQGCSNQAFSCAGSWRGIMPAPSTWPSLSHCLVSNIHRAKAAPF